jgi:hypothetical protein
LCQDVRGGEGGAPAAAAAAARIDIWKRGLLRRTSGSFAASYIITPFI